MDNTFMEEDFEIVKEEIYLEEHRRELDSKYWEWYEHTEGKVIIKNEDGTETEIEEILPSYKLPF